MLPSSSQAKTQNREWRARGGLGRWVGCSAAGVPADGLCGRVSSPTPNITGKLCLGFCFKERARQCSSTPGCICKETRETHIPPKTRSKSAEAKPVFLFSAGKSIACRPRQACLTSTPGVGRTPFHATSRRPRRPRRRQFHLRPRCPQPRPPLRDTLSRAQAAITAEKPPTCTMRSASTPASPAPSSRARPGTRRRPPLPAPTPKLR